MRLFSGKKIGQSGPELVLAILFSFILHALVIIASFYVITVVAIPKAIIPPFYQVKLVGRPADLAEAPQGDALPSPPQKEEKPRVPKKTQKPALKPRKASAKKGSLPDLLPRKQKTPPQEQKAAESAPPGPSSERATPENGPTKPVGKSEGVAIGSTSQEFKFPPYLAIIREKIEQNWNPPPGGRDMKVKVLFRILRSGRVGDSKLEQSSGNFYFDQAAVRAILLSSPFPPLPEGFFKDYEVFSVDLMEKE
jgi:TonB family protein